MLELILEFFWIVWSFFKLICIGVYSLFQDLYREHKTPSALPPQHGRVAIVTGGSSGIGFHVTKSLCELGMHVIIVDYTDCTSLTGEETASSSKKNIESSIKSIKKQVPDAVLEGFEVDLGSIKSVHKFAHQFKSRRLPLHILINNAAVMHTPYKKTVDGIEKQIAVNFMGHFLLDLAAVMHIPYKKTVDGIEKQIAVNFMGHFLLTILLLPVLNVSGTNQLFARVVNVSSSAHRVGEIDLTTFTSKGAKPSRYSPYSAYAQSKLAVIMGTYEMARRLKAAKCFRVTVNCLHPGLVDSNLHSKATFPAPLLRRLIGRFYKSPSQGADTVLYVALSPDLEKQTGGYYENCQKATSSKKSQSFQVQQAIWHTTCSVLNIDPHDLPSSRSHELMSSSGLAFSWHEDYINSPYQTNVGSPEKKPGAISIDKPLPPLEDSEETKKTPSDSCVIDFEKDGEPGPHDRHGSSLDAAESTNDVQPPPAPPPPPKRKTDLNANVRLEKETDISVRNRSDSSTSEPILIHQAVAGKSSNLRKDSAPDIFVSQYSSRGDCKLELEKEDNIICREFMSTPTIENSSPSSTVSSRLRAVMCGSDIIYIPDDDEENSRLSSTVPSGTSTPGASGSYISMEEGGLTPSRLSEEISRARSRSGSSGHIPCIQLDESLLESLQSEPDSGNEASGFSFVNETGSKSPSQKSLFDSSPMRSQTAGSSPATSQASLRGSPCPRNVSPDVSKEERQFDIPGAGKDTPDKIKNDSMSADIREYKQWKEQPLKSTSPGLRDSSDEEFEDWSRLPNRKLRRQDSPSISDDDEDYRQERGRTMVRRCSRTRIPSVEKLDEDADDVNLGLPYPGMTNITITLDDYESTGSTNDSPKKITPYQDSVILDFVNGIITESVKLVQKSKDSPSAENSTKTESVESVLEKAAATFASIDSVDEEIRLFMREGNETFTTPSHPGNQEQKSNPFAQKGWDRLPHDISDAELKAFAEHTILYNEMMRTGRPNPVKIQLDTVSEEIAPESDSSPSNIIPETVPATPPKTLPKPKSPTIKKPQSAEQPTLQDTPSPITIYPPSPKVKVLAQEFEEKMQDLDKGTPACPQNSPKSYSSDSDSTVQSTDEVKRPGLEGESGNDVKNKKVYKKMESSSSSDEKDDLESPDSMPGIGISHIIFSPGISPVKTKSSEDVMFMFQLPSENYKKASIVELGDNENSDADDIIQGVPLLEDDSDDEEEEESDNQFQDPQFKFHPKKDATPSKFEEESTGTSTDNSESKDESTKEDKSPDAPPVAKKPVRPEQGSLTPEKPPAVAGKPPPKPRQDPPTVAKKPVKPDSTPATPEKTTNESTTTSESTAEKTAVSSAKDTESPGKFAINPVAREKSSSSTIPVPSFRKPIQEPVSPETSFKSLNRVSVNQMKSAIEKSVKQTASNVKKPVIPARRTTSHTKELSSPKERPTSPIKHPSSPSGRPTSLLKEPSSPMRPGTSPIKELRQVKEPTSPIGRPTSPVKEPNSPVGRGTSPMKEASSPIGRATSPINELSSPIRRPTSPVNKPSSPVVRVTSPMKESSSPVGRATSPMKGRSSPIGRETSPLKGPGSPVRQTISPVGQIASPVKGPNSPVWQAASTVKGPSLGGQVASTVIRLMEQSASPVKEPSSAVEQTASPVKGPSSPVRQAANPVKGPSSPVWQAASNVKGPSLGGQVASTVIKLMEQAASPVKGPSSPVGQAASPVKEPSSAVKQTASPVKGPSSPVGQAASPIKGPSSPVGQAASPVKGPSSPVGQAASPVKGPSSPVGQAASPVKGPSSPVWQAASNVKGPSLGGQVASTVIRLMEQSASPVKGPSSAVEQTASPVKGPSRPVSQAASPVKGPSSPVGQSASPVKGPSSPVRQAASPVKGPSSQVRQVASPVKRPSSPVGQAASPVKGPSSPVGQAASPVKGPSSPVGQAAGPVKGSSSPVRQAASPVKGPSSPVWQAAGNVKRPSLGGQVASTVMKLMEQAASPVKEPSSAVKQTASPVKGPSSPVRQAATPVKGPSSSVGQVASPVKKQDIPVVEVSGPITKPDSHMKQVTSPVKESSSPVGQATSVMKGKSSPVGHTGSENEHTSSMGQAECSSTQQGSPIKQAAKTASSPTTQQVSHVSQVGSPVKQQDSPVRQATSPVKARVSPATAVSVSPKKATEKLGDKPEEQNIFPGSPTQESKLSSDDHHPTATKSAEKNIRPESPQGLTANIQTCRQIPTLKALKQLGQEEKCLSFDSTDPTDISEASNVSLYAMAMSSFESDDCWFDSQPYSPEHSTITEESDYDQVMALYKSDPDCSHDDDDDNDTLHSDPLSFSKSETKTEEDEDNPKDSQSNC